MSATVVPVPADQIAHFCQQHGVRWLALFGSVLRDDFGPDSDIDVLVTFEPEQRVGLLTMVRLEGELSRLSGGRRVDLRTPGDLSRSFRDRVVAGAQVLHERGREASTDA